MEEIVDPKRLGEFMDAMRELADAYRRAEAEGAIPPDASKGLRPEPFWLTPQGARRCVLVLHSEECPPVPELPVFPLTPEGVSEAGSRLRGMLDHSTVLEAFLTLFCEVTKRREDYVWKDDLRALFGLFCVAAGLTVWTDTRIGRALHEAGLLSIQRGNPRRWAWCGIRWRGAPDAD